MELTSLQTSLTRTSDKQLLLLKASDSSQQSSPTFKLDEVQDILLEEGFDRTLDTFKEWEKTRKFYPIKIVTDANTGKTTISGEYNGVSLEFIGTCERDHELIVLDQVSEQKPESEINLTTLSEAASTIMNKITTYITGSEINMYAKIYSKIHTEFGLDSNGKIIFQESSTQEVYDYLKDQIVTDMTEQYPEEVAALGGAEGLERILQAAWIETYSSFNSSQSNDTKAFVNKVVANLQTILSKISNNPELLEVYTSHTNYADKTLTDGLENYKNSSAITYSDADIYMDGFVHIQDTQSDKLYQQTMSSLLDKLKAKYPKLDESVIAKLFKQAQVNALNNCANNTADCPYGTDNGGNDRVYDTKLDWGGKDEKATRTKS